MLTADEFTRKPVYNVLLIGLKGSGKTWMLERVGVLRSAHAKLRASYLDGVGPSSRIAPTVGQNVLDIPYNKSVVHIWDLGGSISMRDLWKTYLKDAHAVVWVLDAVRWATDAEVVDGACTAYRDSILSTLFTFVGDAAERGQPLVIVVSKVDALGPDVKASHGFPQDQVHARGVLEHVRSTIQKRCASFVKENAQRGLPEPQIVFVCASAVTGEGIADAMRNVYSLAQRYAPSTARRPYTTPR